MENNINESKNFSKKVKELFLKEKNIDVDTLDYMEMPEKTEHYNLMNVIGNVNLVAGRFRTKSEANDLIDNFLHSSLP